MGSDIHKLCTEVWKVISINYIHRCMGSDIHNVHRGMGGDIHIVQRYGK